MASWMRRLIAFNSFYLKQPNCQAIIQLQSPPNNTIPWIWKHLNPPYKTHTKQNNKQKHWTNAYDISQRCLKMKTSWIKEQHNQTSIQIVPAKRLKGLKETNSASWQNTTDGCCGETCSVCSQYAICCNISQVFGFSQQRIYVDVKLM